MRHLLAQEQVVLGKLQLPFFVGRVREIVVRFRKPELERERIADAHAVFAVQHECDRAGDVRIERQRDQIEHGAVILRRLSLGRRVEIQMRVILLLERDIDPALGRDQPRFHLVQRGQVLIHPLAVGFARAAGRANARSPPRRRPA